MCEFCHKHGEGSKWYLRAENYSEELLNDAKRRKFIREFLAEPERLAADLANLDKIDKAPPIVRRALVHVLTSRQKKTHYGQVVPLEDVERILGFVNSVVRLPCVCRKITRGKEKRYCYGVSISPDAGKLLRSMGNLAGGFAGGPDLSGFEKMSKEDFLLAMREHEREGLCHTIWTFHTPFIGGVCNCDRSDCIAMRATVSHGFPVMFRAEYAARIDREKCTGCRQCMKVCQFGAISYGAAERKAAIDDSRCYGCGICRAACGSGSISLLDRASVPAAAGLW